MKEQPIPQVPVHTLHTLEAKTCGLPMSYIDGVSRTSFSRSIAHCIASFLPIDGFPLVPKEQVTSQHREGLTGWALKVPVTFRIVGANYVAQLTMDPVAAPIPEMPCIMREGSWAVYVLDGSGLPLRDRSVNGSQSI